MSMIAKKYADRVENGEITLEQVPSLWREKVRIELEERNKIELVPVEPEQDEVIAEETTDKVEE